MRIDAYVLVNVIKDVKSVNTFAIAKHVVNTFVMICEEEVVNTTINANSMAKTCAASKNPYYLFFYFHYCQL